MLPATDLAKRHGWIALAVLISGTSTARIWHDTQMTAGGGISALFGWIPDITTFSNLGDAVLQGDLLTPYASPFNQAGPVQIVGDAVLYRGLSLLPEPLGFACMAMVVTLIPLIAGGLVSDLLTRAMGVQGSRWLWTCAWFTVLALGLVGADEDYLMSGHWWQIPVLLLWALAAAYSASGRVAAAGALVGLSMGLEPWGVFGLVVSLLAPATGQIVRVLGAAAVAAAVLWIPFVVTGSFHLGGYRWIVRSDSLWSWIVGEGSPFPWSLRTVQACLVAGLAAWVAVSYIRPLSFAERAERTTGWILLPAIIVLLRVATDVWFGSYYLMTPAVMLLPAAFAWLFRDLRVGLWLSASAWLELVGAAGRLPFALAAAAAATAIVGVRTLRRPSKVLG